MKQIHLTITAQAPLAIGQRKPGGSVSEAMDYIPGTVIRGAIAGKILQQAQGQQPEPGDSFHTLFLDESSAIFQNAYPAIANWGKGEYTVGDGDVHVLPATALSSKTESGFKPNQAGVFDSLIDSFCAREHGLFYEPNSIEGDRVEPFAGFYSQEPDGKYVSHSVSKRLLTRVGINRRRTTAQDEILYSIEVMNESQGKKHPQPTVYKGAILVDNDALGDALHQFIERNRYLFRLGGSVSRGLGKVDIVAVIEDVETSGSSFSQRIEIFNQALKQRWDFWNAFGVLPNPVEEKRFFALALQSDAILTENWRRTMVISEDMLCQFTSLSRDKVELHMAYSSYDYRSGWNAAWGLPKDVELITKMGSVFLLSVPKAQAKEWEAKLADLERRGVGDRTVEGFGQLKVCDEFHLIMREAPV